MIHWRVKLSLLLNYFVLAILLNSVGTVILQVQNNYRVSASSASILEAFKNLTIALVSFIVASCITRIGYKRAMLFALALVTLACLSMPQAPAFWTTKLLFAAIGASFALTKVSVYATIGLIANDTYVRTCWMHEFPGVVFYDWRLIWLFPVQRFCR
ncbi:MFS transporter [Spirosoma endophyticum]|uniref:Major Facilitator Superfamily protein n=1 Tax=Spirosoma endophyticum TaxID=662367 RepID=A0A1I1Q7I5_9BACT|nr:hypothetical protein [Spirosoma endophyticum]SFD15818.1 hypothetical protein SAMN05216167_103557 [Spirosoma endophyticum]